jgi:hypothetical protein
MKLTKFFTLAIVAIAYVSGCAVANADDWPEFLGKSRSGKSAETGLIDAFGADGPRMAS